LFGGGGGGGGGVVVVWRVNPLVLSVFSPFLSLDSLDRFTTRGTNAVAGVANFVTGGDALRNGLVGHLRLQLDEAFCTYLMPTIYATVADEVRDKHTYI